MKKQIKKGFTLAEVLITLTILGVVAALTIPSVMRTQNEAAERTKLKKAIVDYEKLISNMTIENSLTSIEALKDYANKDNCVKSRTYFKIKQDDTNSPSNNCIFQTSNGVWWNVMDITRPVISTKGVENLSTADGENSFLLTTTYSDTARAFIVDDLSSSQLTDEEKAQLKKTLAFTKIISSSGSNDVPSAPVDLKSAIDNLGTYATTACTNEKKDSCYVASAPKTICLVENDGVCSFSETFTDYTFYDSNGTAFFKAINTWDAEDNEERRLGQQSNGNIEINIDGEWVEKDKYCMNFEYTGSGVLNIDASKCSWYPQG